MGIDLDNSVFRPGNAQNIPLQNSQVQKMVHNFLLIWFKTIW